MAPKVPSREKRRDRHAMAPLHRNGISGSPEELESPTF